MRGPTAEIDALSLYLSKMAMHGHLLASFPRALSLITVVYPSSCTMRARAHTHTHTRYVAGDADVEIALIANIAAGVILADIAEVYMW